MLARDIVPKNRAGLAKTDIWQGETVKLPVELTSERLLELARDLQTTLNPEQIIEVFAARSRALADFDAVGFVSHSAGVSVESGPPQTHSCTYTLVVSDEVLGEISFSRRRPFTEEEVERLELLGSQVVYPLRNAIMHRVALLAAARDPLTGVFNRLTLEPNLAREVSLAHRHDTAFSVLMLDLDHFKRINDRYGHRSGDCVLKGVVERIRSCIRDSDSIYRFGGEEFTILLSNTGGPGALRLAERIRSSIRQTPVVCDGQEIPISASIGVAALEHREEGGHLLGRADRALYRAKAEGRNRSVVDG